MCYVHVFKKLVKQFRLNVYWPFKFLTTFVSNIVNYILNKITFLSQVIT